MNSKQTRIIILSIFCLVVIACSPSREQVAATMAVQTIEARRTGTADVEQADSLTKSGLAYYEKGDFDQAIADFDQAIALSPQDGDVYFYRGRVYRNKGDLDQAIADFDQAIALTPQFADAFLYRGEAYLGKGNPDQAIANFDQAITLNPMYAQAAGAYFLRGFAYYENGDFNQTIADMSQAIDGYVKVSQGPAFTDEAVAYLYRGTAYAEIGEQEKAISDIERALELGLDSRFVNNAKELLENLKKETTISTNTPTFTATPEIQEYFTEDFDDLQGWSTFSVDTTSLTDGIGHPYQMMDVWITGKKPRDSGQSVNAENGYLKFNNNRTEATYAIYDSVEYEDVRIDAQFENKGSNTNLTGLVCHYSENVGWYEIVITPGSGIVNFARIKEDGAINYYGVADGNTYDKIRSGVNDISVICEGSKITFYLNDTLVLEKSITDANFSLESGKAGVIVASHNQLPVQVDFDWVKISPASSQVSASTPATTSETVPETPERVEDATPGPPPSGLPEAETSEYLQTNFGAFNLDLESSTINYILSLNLIKDLPSDAYIEAYFENPADPLNPIVVTQNGPQPKSFELKSPPLDAIEKKTYWVEVIIYSNPDKETILGRHIQWIRFSLE